VTSNPPSILLAKSRQPILDTVLAAVIELIVSTKTSLLTLWGGRGVGKTFLLDLVEEKVVKSDSGITAQRWDLRQHSFDDIRAGISNCIDAAGVDHRRVILLDNFDVLLHNDPDGSDFFAIEREIILPAVEKGCCLFVVTSQIELTNWREYEVRQCQQGFQIPSLFRQDVDTLTQDVGLDPKQIYELTYGHPKAIAWLQEQSTISSEAISERAFEYFLEGLSPDVQQLTNQICLMPLFNPFLLRTIASQSDSSPGTLYLKHLDQIRELMGIGLIYWDLPLGAYRFRDNAIRRLLARRIRLHDPQLFQRIHETTWQYYQAETLLAGFLHRHLVSAVYHLAKVQLANSGSDVGTDCLDWVTENLTNWGGAKWPEVLEMWVSGNNDPALAEEVIDLIGITSFDAIADCLKEAEYGHR